MNNKGEFISAVVLVYFRCPVLDGALSINSGLFFVSDVGDGCAVCLLGDK